MNNNNNNNPRRNYVEAKEANASSLFRKAKNEFTTPPYYSGYGW